MWHSKIGLGFLIGLCAVSTFAQAPQSDGLAKLRAGFRQPPAEVRPMVRWWWFGVDVEKPELLRELEQMKADGIGGVELAFVYPQVLDDPEKGLVNWPFLSPQMFEAVHYAQTEGRRLGLRLDVTLCSGWPYGGPSTTLEHAAHHLRTEEENVPAGATTAATPRLENGERIVSAALVKEGGPATAFVPGASFAAAPSGRTAMFFLDSPTGQQVKRAAVGAEGSVLDPFSRDAVAEHLKAVGQPLLDGFGATPPYAVFSDSLEAYGADWTPGLPEEFSRRRGYDLTARLPELVKGGTAEAANLRHDYGRTLTELVNENYLAQINTWARAHHTRFRSQTYGEPAVSFSSQRLVDLAEGEGPQWRSFSTLRWASSANHIFGREVTSGESFTWLHSPVFRATPLDMKAESDLDFLIGENQLIFHGWPYSPPYGKVPEPGWSLYAAASFNHHNPWHPVLPAVDAYIARLSFLLRQGAAANQVAILLPTDDAWAGFMPLHVSVTAAMANLISPQLIGAVLNAGYNLDFLDADAIASVGLGTHQIVVIPPTDRIPVETLRRLEDWSAKGGKVIAVGHLPRMTAEGKPLPATPQGLTLVSDSAALGDALHAAAEPDFQLDRAADEKSREQIGFIRRRLSFADIYFVANTGNTPVETTVRFATTHPRGEEWGLDGVGGATPAVARNQALRLAPYESRVFVFAEGMETKFGGASSPPAQRVLTDLSSDWTVRFPASGLTRQEPTLRDWTADPATLHYSGEAVYAREFTLPAPPSGRVYLEVDGGRPVAGGPSSEPAHSLLANGMPDPKVTRPGPGMKAYFEPPIREAALVLVNGHQAGALWHPPYRLDVAGLLRAGKNRLEIRVFNTALNGWSALPPHNYQPLIARYGDRFQMQDLDQVRPVSSGLLGSVKLVLP
jgi:alpha-L-rhamnosidase